MVPATSDPEPAPRVTFVWGLKRSGIHLVVSWLYANHGATVKKDLSTDGLHVQLCDGFGDPAAGVAFYNNCGRLHSRQFELGDVLRDDFERAARRHRVAIFGIEDCALQLASRTSGLAGSTNVLLLRDPLNNLASRLEVAKTRPEPFRVDESYIDLFEAYCAEALGHTDDLSPKVVISYNRFVADRAYRDGLAAALGLQNLDEVSEVSGYGGWQQLLQGRSAESGVRDEPIPPAPRSPALHRHAARARCGA